MSSIKLRVAEPCHENWNNMSPSEKGRFCGSCQKQVVDFTKYSDTQIVDYFTKASAAATCGRFFPDQLETRLAAPKRNLSWAKYAFSIVIPALLGSVKLKAQDSTNVVADTIPKIECSPLMGVVAYVPEKIEKSRMLIGRIIDNEGNGIPFASVLVKGTTSATAADQFGNFRLTVKGKEQKLLLQFNSEGYTPKEKLVSVNTRNFKIKLETNPREIMGKIAVYRE